MSMIVGCYERGGPASEVIEIGRAPVPEPGPDDVLVRLHASGINPSDYKKRGNARTPMEFSRIVPHSDGAGVVERVGRNVKGFQPGARVWVFNGQWERPQGTAAQFIALPASQVRPLPDHTTFAEGACLGIPAMTACRVIFMDGPVRGQTVYVPGAAGRVGAYAVQFAKWGGARVIASVSGAEKSDVAHGLGADEVIDRSRQDVAETVLKLTGGRGVDRIAEVEFGGNMAINARILAEGGVIASYASAQVPVAQITVSPRRARNMSIHFVFVYLLDAAAIESTCALVQKAEQERALRHRIAATYPLERLAEAHASAERQSGSGHVIVTIDQRAAKPV